MRAGEDTVVNQELTYDEASARTSRPALLLPREPVDDDSPSAPAPHAARPSAWRASFATPAPTIRRRGRSRRSPGCRSGVCNAIRGAMQHADDETARALPDGAGRRCTRARPRRSAQRGSTCSSPAGKRSGGADRHAHLAAACDAPDDAVLAIGGRPGDAATGLLSAGTAYQAAQRLLTFTRYARVRVRGAARARADRHVGVGHRRVPGHVHDRRLRRCRGRVPRSRRARSAPSSCSRCNPAARRWRRSCGDGRSTSRSPMSASRFDVRPDVAFAEQAAELAATACETCAHASGRRLVLARGGDPPRRGCHRARGPRPPGPGHAVPARRVRAHSPRPAALVYA